MQLVMIKAGEWQIQHLNGTAKTTFWSRTIQFGQQVRTVWRCSPLPSGCNPQRKQSGDFASLSKALKHAEPNGFGFDNYPGPLRIIEKVYGDT